MKFLQVSDFKSIQRRRASCFIVFEKWAKQSYMASLRKKWSTTTRGRCFTYAHAAESTGFQCYRILWVSTIYSTDAICLTSAKLIPSVQLTDTTGTTVQRPTGQSNPISPITVVTNSSRLANINKSQASSNQHLSL